MFQAMLPKLLIRFTLLILGGLANWPVHAETYVLPPPDVDLVGEIRVINASHDETLLDIARRYSLGYDEIIHANPGVDRWLAGTRPPI